tara:strand:- start:160 stop:1218 length:1059 start_codon:yes stop_codon:yes gene_type:complete
MNVCILGNGLTSLSLAKALVNLEINVDIISNTKNLKLDETRTIGLTHSNIEFFNKNISNIDKLLWKIKEIRILNDNLKNEELINFNNNKKYLFATIKNKDFYNLLHSNLSKSKKLTFKKKLIFAKYNLIINCDPTNILTKKFFFKNINKNYNSFAYTTIIEHKKLINNNTALQIFTKNGPLAFLPLSNTKTSIVYSYKGKKISNIHKLVNFYNKKYIIEKFDEYKTFSLKSSNLRNYYHQNILAFGDLLHKIHPLAGQGFNMTVRDIQELVKIVKFKIEHGLILDSSVCMEFEKKTKHKNYLFSNSVDFLYEFFNFERKIKSKILNKTIKFLGKQKSTNNIFTKLADNGIVI